jgi:DNA-3-methyladenine glycosylase
MAERGRHWLPGVEAPLVPLGMEYWGQDTLQLAPSLLGCVLVVDHGGGDVRAGRIVEVEAYCGPEDLCAHTARGRLSARNRAMHGPAGHAYIYRIYGIHLCFNVVSGPEGVPHAILVRALEPLLGTKYMAEALGDRSRTVDSLCRGPGLLCRSMGITMDDYGCNLREPGRIWLGREEGAVRVMTVGTSARINVRGGEEWERKPWRYFVLGHKCVSGPARLNGPIVGTRGGQTRKSVRADQ